MNLSEAFVVVVRLAELLGVSHINKLPGLWRCQVDDKWSIAVNAKEQTIEGIPTHHMAVDYNGWPAALLNPFQGTFVVSEHVNEDTFIAAVKIRIEQLQMELGDNEHKKYTSEKGRRNHIGSERQRINT